METEMTTMKIMKALWQQARRLGLGLGAWAASGAALASVNSLPGGPAVNQLNLHPPVTRIAEEQHFLHWMMLIICLVIFVGVFSVMFYSILKHRKSVGAKAASFHESTTVEVIWTIVPFLIVIGMALPATKVVVAMKDTTNADITVKATGYQWKWGYDYLTEKARASLSSPPWTSPIARCPTLASPPVTTTCSRSTTRWWCLSTRKSASSPRPTT